MIAVARPCMHLTPRLTEALAGTDLGKLSFEVARSVDNVSAAVLLASDALMALDALVGTEPPELLAVLGLYFMPLARVPERLSYRGFAAWPLVWAG